MNKSTTNYDIVFKLAHKDYNDAKEFKLHAEDHIHALSTRWIAIEHAATIVGYDILQAGALNPTLREKIQTLRVLLLVVLPVELRLARTGANEAAYLQHRGETYGDSWKKRGGVGAFMMLARKWDRIENICGGENNKLKAAIRDNLADIVDDIDDLRRYLLLVESEFA